MILDLDKSDNEILSEFIKNHNDNSLTSEIIIDVYISAIEFIGNDVIFKCVIAEQNNDNGVKYKSAASIGEEVDVRLSTFEEPEKSVLKSFLRDIKIGKIGI